MPEPPYNTIYYACRRRPAISAIVVNDTWAALQVKSGGTIDTRPIDAALAEIAKYNATAGQSLGVRLRIWAGIDAPQWAKSLGGRPIPICNSNAPSPSPSPPAAAVTTPAPTCPAFAIATVGRFWSPPYAAAWRNLQAQVARKYDSDLAVNDVSVSSCSSLTSEPFVQPEDDFSKTNLVKAGYTDRAYALCLSRAIDDDYKPYWHITPVAYSFNPFRKIETKPPSTDLPFTESLIDSCRAALGPRCILLNETMAKFANTSTPTGASYYEMWAYMQSRGGPISFQTASPPKLLDAWKTNAKGWNEAVALAAHFGATSVELFPQEKTGPCTTPTRKWVNGYTCFATATMLKWRAEILASH